MSGRDDFYVGYLPRCPEGLAAWLRPRIVLLLALGAVCAGGLAGAMQPFPPKTFEWGTHRDFLGWVEAEPVPSLLVRIPAADLRTPGGWARYLLVRPGKHGAAEEALAHDGELVHLSGTLIHREDQAMIELVPGSLERADAPGAAAPALDVTPLGTHTLVGEIVDSKCYLGVMAPGDTKPHRACAARCISGGIPPVFLVRDASGRAAYLLLLAADGSAVNDAVLPLIAEPLEITGSVERHADLLVLKADPVTYRRIS